MTFMLENLGCNSGYLSPKEIQTLGYNFIETSINKPVYDQAMVVKMLGDLDEAIKMQMRYAIHLPVFLSEDWVNQYDCYDAFYLDPNPEKREVSFQMLEENLSALTKMYAPMYFVIHFPGIYGLETVYTEDFDLLLDSALNRIDALGGKYGCTIALEYFATNLRFACYEEWIKKLEPLKHVAPLLDTGHLYFNCYKNNFDYDTVLDRTCPSLYWLPYLECTWQ